LFACHLFDIFAQDIRTIARGAGGYFGVQVTGENQKSFLSLKFSIPGFFGVGKFGLKLLFWGALIQIKICFDIQNKLKIRGSACASWLLNVLLIFCVISFRVQRKSFLQLAIWAS